MGNITLFHSAPTLLAPGSVVLPGNWGRIIRFFGERHDKWGNEQIFESIRLNSHPDRPSRLDSCFACIGEAGLRFFVNNNVSKGGIMPVLYEVEKVEAAAIDHTADYNLFQVNLPGETIEGQAERYWKGEFRYVIESRPGLVCDEVLTASPLRILRQLAD